MSRTVAFSAAAQRLAPAAPAADVIPIAGHAERAAQVTTRGGRTTPPSLDDIWIEYARERDLAHRNQLIVVYQPLIARALRGLPFHLRSYWAEDELRSFGQDGLVQAIERWDGMTTKFKAYAIKRIRGAIFDEFRRLDWMPRTTRERMNSARVVQDHLTQDLKRTPTHDEVFAAMSLDDRQGADLLVELWASQLLHLSVPIEGDSNETLGDLLPSRDDAPDSQLLRDVLAQDLEKALSTLLPREQAIIQLAFVAGVSQEQIGDIIGVSGSQICKIQGRALTKLRTALGPAYLGDERLAPTG